MNTRFLVPIVIIGLAAIGVLVFTGMNKEENKQKVALTELPAAVQKTIQDESIQTKLKDKASPKEISRVVHGTLEELREDIGRELREKKG